MNAARVYRARVPTILIPILLVALNLLLKLLVLGDMSIWGDEAFSIFFSQQDLTGLNQRLATELNPPLYFYLLHFWIQLFSIDVLPVKLLSVLFSCGCIFYIYKAGEWIGGIRTGLLASLFYLFSNMHFDFSHEVRAYSLVCFEVTASFYYFLKYSRDKKRSDLVLMTVWNALIAYSHYIALSVPLVQFLLLVSSSKWTEIRPVLLSYLALVLVFLPQMMSMFNMTPGQDFWLKIPNWSDLCFVLYKLPGNDGFFWFLFLPFLLGIIPALFPRARRFLFSDEFKPRFFLTTFAWFFLPVLITYGLAQFTPVFRLRYVLFSSIGLYLGLSYLLTQLRAPGSQVFLLLLVYFLFFFISYDADNRDTEKWKETAGLLKRYSGGNCLTLVSANYKMRDLAYYFDRPAFSDYKHFGDRLAGEHVLPFNGMDQLHSLDLEKYDKVILVLSHQNVVDPENELLQFFEEGDYVECENYNSDQQAGLMVFVKKGQRCENLALLSAKLDEDQCVQARTSTYLDRLSQLKVFARVYKFIQGMPCHADVNPISEGGSYRINALHPFSPTLEIPAEDVKKVKVYFSLRARAGNRAEVVFSVEKGRDIIQYQHVPLKDSNEGLLKYQFIPPLSGMEGAVVKLYLWNPGEDDLDITYLEYRWWQ